MACLPVCNHMTWLDPHQVQCRCAELMSHRCDNNLIHNSTHVSPFYANYSFHPTFSFPHLHQSLTPATSDFLSHLSMIHSKLKAELKLAQESMKLKYDVH